MMMLHLLNHRAFIAMPFLRPIKRVSFFSTYSQLKKKWESGGRVSMVQGASRGIGLEFVKQLLEENDKGHVVATCRNPNGAKGLLELRDKFVDRLDIQRLDLTMETTIEESAKSIRDRYGSLNLLINASGILSIPEILQPETTLNKVERSSLMLSYEVNAVGPILVIKHMWPLLKAGGGSGTERDSAVVANLSARVGSIGDNRLGGWHSYRSSKSALNQRLFDVTNIALVYVSHPNKIFVRFERKPAQFCVSSKVLLLGRANDHAKIAHYFTSRRRCGMNTYIHDFWFEPLCFPGIQNVTRTVSVEFARKKDPIICLLLHPGTVDTDLSKPFQRNVAEGKLFTKEFSVQKLLSIINNAKRHDNGKFFAWDGQEIPW